FHWGPGCTRNGLHCFRAGQGCIKRLLRIRGTSGCSRGRPGNIRTCGCSHRCSRGSRGRGRRGRGGGGGSEARGHRWLDEEPTQSAARLAVEIGIFFTQDPGRSSDRPGGARVELLLQKGEDHVAEAVAWKAWILVRGIGSERDAAPVQVLE